jgi:hypothetical protein
MTTPKFTFRLPPQAELLAKQFLFELGKAGAKATAAGAKSLVTDVRKKFKEADQFLAHAERVAKEKAKDEDE